MSFSTIVAVNFPRWQQVQMQESFTATNAKNPQRAQRRAK
jgi:hypothetical protein